MRAPLKKGNPMVLFVTLLALVLLGYLLTAMIWPEKF
ncbi:potassium-transporting ATPase subunit F [Verrucomicrobium sp. GAS474]|nr:potassium-transporting ATPase subunit F [Verrucomicrobium sp. GAS474]